MYHYPSCYHVNAIKPQNLVSFPTAAAAQAAGYRPCKDCHPPT
ncbi:MAG: Ada metal-binding domain-containing protein [Halobacteriota archaeon]